MIRNLAVAILLFCSVALAQPGGPQGGPGGPGPGFHGGPPMMRPDGETRGMLPPGRWWKDAEVVKNIGLNDTQIQKIEQIFQNSRLKLVDIHANLQREELKLEPLLEADNPDENAVLAAIDRITAARASLEKANAQMAFAIRRVLTPEQWKKLRTQRPHREHFPPPMMGPQGHMQPPSPGDKQAPSDKQPVGPDGDK